MIDSMHFVKPTTRAMKFRYKNHKMNPVEHPMKTAGANKKNSELGLNYQIEDWEFEKELKALEEG